MKMPEKYVYLNFQIDANRINAKSQLKFMNILQYWYENDVINIEMSEVAQNEAAEGNNPVRRETAYSYIASETLAATPEEAQMLSKIENILFPHGVRKVNEKNDVEIVFNAWKYGCILITDDGGSRRQPGGILGNRNKLANLNIQVMRDKEAIEIVKRKIMQRDEHAKKIASYKNEPLPEWVGRDLEILKSTGL